MHKRTLVLYSNISRSKVSIEKKLALRQPSLSTHTKDSWFAKIRVLLSRYHVVSAHNLVEDVHTMDQLRVKVKTNLKEH